MKFNEDSRVKIPSILHLTRLGYDYLPLKDAEWNIDTNIFTDVFLKSVLKINDGLKEEDAKRHKFLKNSLQFMIYFKFI